MFWKLRNVKVLPNQVCPTHSKPVVDMPRFAGRERGLFMRQSSEKTGNSLKSTYPKVRDPGCMR